MPDYILLMHTGTKADDALWTPYLAKLRAAGCFQGGSAFGGGVCATKSGTAPEITQHLGGYVKIKANDLEHATQLLAGNPVYEAGGIVEIRELPST